MKKLILGLFLSFTLVLSAPVGHALEDAIIAIVNDEVVTLKDLRAYMAQIYSQLKVEGRSPAEIDDIMQQYEEKGIEQLIEDRLILSRATEQGIVIKDEMLKKRLGEIRANYKTDSEFTDALLSEGITISDLKGQFANQLKAKVVVDHEVRSKIFVNPQEVTQYYKDHPKNYFSDEKVFLESIFISKAKGNSLAREKAEEAYQKIRNGESFLDVAKDYSELPSVGVLEKGQLLQELEEVVFALQENEVTDVMEVSNGYYIFQLTGRQFQQVRELTDVKDEIYQRLFHQKFQKRYRKWISKLRSKAYIEIK